MSRYVKDYTINIEAEELLEELETYIISEGYTTTEYDGQLIYKKSSGAMNSPSYIKIRCEDTLLRIQAWIKFAMLPNVFIGEYDLQGVIGRDINGPLAERLQKIDNIIQNYIEAHCETAAESTATESTAAESTAAKEEYIFCTNCGTKLNKSMSFCTMCGKKIKNQETENNYSDETKAFAEREYYMSKKDFIKNKAPASFKTTLKVSAIVLYVCLGLSAVVGLIQNPLALVDVGIMLGLTLGMHLGKNKACAIALLAVTIFEVVVTLIVTHTFGGWLPVVFAIMAVSAFSKVDKQYKSYIKRL